jgi:xylulokinase
VSYVIGIDVSTTATKAVVVDENGEIVSTGVSGYGFETPKPLWSEQDPGLWWTATVEALNSALTTIDASDVKAVGLTGQMHGLTLLDGAGQPLRPALLWNDQRTVVECDEIRAALGRRRLIETTGNDALTGFTAPKILWVRKHEPDLFARAAHVLLPKDFVRHRLTGDYATDKAGGSGTLLFDLAKRTWSEEVVAALDIDPRLLPPTFEGTAITGTITKQAAGLTGLPAGTPVVGGGGDQAASAIGTGVIDPGTVTVSVGTSGVVFAATDEPAFEPRARVHAFCHAVPARWHMMGVMLSAAGSYQWFRDTLAPGVSFPDLDDEAETVAAGSDGLLFLPYLSGERTPHPDPNARGAFVGLTLRHTRAHLARAVLEGVAFGLRDGLDLMVAAGTPTPNSVRISGGGARSQLWRQIIADVLDTHVETVSTHEGAAYGAAVLAAVGAQWDASATALSARWTSVTATVEPGTAVAIYADAHEVYRHLYPALKPAFPAIG